MSANVRSARALTAAERRARVVELRRERATFKEIGAELGISGPAAWKLYQKALREIPAAQLDEHRAEEIVLLDDAVNDLLKLARDHSRPRYAVEAWNCIIRASERKARLLGLDAPLKKSIEVIEQHVVDAEIARLAAELGERAMEGINERAAGIMPPATRPTLALPPSAVLHDAEDGADGY